MEENTRKSKKRKWKEVTFDNPAFFSGNMEGFVSLEELHDYTLESVANDEGSRVASLKDINVLEKKEKTVNSDDKQAKKVPASTDVGKKKKKKKRKKKKPKKSSDETPADESNNDDDNTNQEGAVDESENKTQGNNEYGNILLLRKSSFS
jgi:hypothetical protein